MKMSPSSCSAKSMLGMSHLQSPAAGIALSPVSNLAECNSMFIKNRARSLMSNHYPSVYRAYWQNRRVDAAAHTNPG